MRVRENNVERILTKEKDLKGYVMREFAEALIAAVEEQIKKDGNKSIMEKIR
jgi:hypothetical protein